MVKKYKWLLLFVLAVGIMSVTGCKKQETMASLNNNEIKPIAISAVTVDKGIVESAITLSGKVMPIQDINISAKVPGKVVRINFEVGQQVKKGDILFSIDDSDIRLQLKQAEAALIAAKAALNRTTGGLLQQQLMQLETTKVSAEINYNDAKTSYETTQKLFEAGAVSKQMLETAESRFNMAKEQYEAAKTNLELTKTKINPENIAAAEAQVIQAQAAYDMAKSQLDNTSVVSPINGTIALINIAAGEFTANTIPAMNIIDLSSVDVAVNVTEDFIGRIHLHDRVKASIKAVGRIFEGEIINISPITDVRTQNFLVKIRISNSDAIIKGGVFAEINIAVDKATDVLTLPIACIMNEEQKSFVYVVNGDTVKKRYITIGLQNDSVVQVTDGLQEGEMVVAKGQNFIQDGSNIFVIE